MFQLRSISEYPFCQTIPKKKQLEYFGGSGRTLFSFESLVIKGWIEKGILNLESRD